MPKRHNRPCLMFVIGMQSTKIGGMEKFLRSLCLGMDAAGWDSVLCFDGEPSSQLQEYLQLPFVTIGNVPDQQGLGQNAAASLWRQLREHRPTVFMYAFHSVMRVFPLLAKAAGVKRIYFNDHSSRPQGVVPAPLKLHKRIVARTLTAPLTGIISVADFTKRSGTAYGMTSAPNVVVKNGIQLLDVDRKLGLEFRARYGIPADGIVITEICWMMPIKGVEVLLEAARGLLARHPRLHLLFVGGGDMLESYRKLASEMEHADRVHFPGIISEPVKTGVLDATDIYCQPSLWQEASGLAVLEAMSKCVPVVASDIGGLPENVLQGVTGFLFPPGNSGSLDCELEKLIADEVLRKRFGEAGRKEVEAEHRIEDMVARYVGILTGAESMQDQ